MKRMASDFLPVLMAAATGELAGVKLEWRPDPTVCVVLASGGYPGSYPTGKPIHGIAEAEATGATVFHAGTRFDSKGLVTSGGRVLGVTASGPTLASAIDNAYRGAGKISFEGMHYRSDIGRKGLHRPTLPAASA
jgi:phosphoribosylamine--glycine ligase